MTSRRKPSTPLSAQKCSTFFDFSANFRIFPIQIGLLFTEQMQIILTTVFIECPGITPNLDCQLFGS